MRHGNKINKLSRTASHRRSMLANMASSLIQHKHITTTLAKAKVLRKYVEPLITKSKSDTTHSRRTVFAYLQDKLTVKELFTEVAPKIMARPGGYTRILKLGPRPGDNSEMALIELVDYNEYLPTTAGKQDARRSRRRQTKKKGAGTVNAVATTATEAPSTTHEVDAMAPTEVITPVEASVQAPEAELAPAPTTELQPEEGLSAAPSPTAQDEDPIAAE